MQTAIRTMTPKEHEHTAEVNRLKDELMDAYRKISELLKDSRKSVPHRVKSRREENTRNENTMKHSEDETHLCLIWTWGAVSSSECWMIFSFRLFFFSSTFQTVRNALPGISNPKGENIHALRGIRTHNLRLSRLAPQPAEPTRSALYPSEESKNSWTLCGRKVLGDVLCKYFVFGSLFLIISFKIIFLKN